MINVYKRTHFVCSEDRDIEACEPTIIVFALKFNAVDHVGGSTYLDMDLSAVVDHDVVVELAIREDDDVIKASLVASLSFISECEYFF